MKKVFAFIAMTGLLIGANQTINAQDAVESAAEEVQEQVVEAAEETTDEIVQAPVEEQKSIHKNIKVKFIEGNAGFMSLVAVAMIIGLALCIERIIFLSLCEINSKKLLEDIQASLENGDIEGAKKICRDTRGPVASICYQGLMRIDQGLDVVERSVVSYGSVQASNLEKNLSWITLFIAMSPSLGFLGTVIGMVQAFDDIQQAGDISPTVVAGGMKVALITTIFGIIVALTMVEQLQGRGSVKGEPHYGNHAWPSMCSGIITMVDDSKVDIVLDKLHAMDVATEKLGLRAFVWNIEKSI